MKKMALLITLVLCTFNFLLSTVINVPTDQPTIQAGIDNANEGDTVLVASGTYFENITWPSVNSIKLIGSGENDCIIDGNSSGSVIHYEIWSTIHDSSTIIKDFTIQNGYSKQGAGIFLRSENQILLENLIIKNNYQYLSRNTEKSNEAKYLVEGGAGIQLDNYSSPIIRNVQIINNFAEFYGGGLFIYHYSEPLLENVLIANNYSLTSGGGIACEASYSFNLKNVTIVNNNASENGGGIYCFNNSNPVLVNCILWNSSLYEIYFAENYFANSITIAYSDVQGGEAGIITNGNGSVNWEEGNINQDPLFANAENGNYYLSEFSPCIDAGTAFYAIGEDTIVNMSPDDYYGSAPDIGAYEWEPSVSTGQTDWVFPVNVAIQSIYPNPFNNSTTVTYQIPKSGQVNLSVYDISGRLVDQLVDAYYKMGEHTITFNTKDLASGMYILHLKTEAGTHSRPVTLLK